MVHKKIMDKVINSLKEWYKSAEWWSSVDYTPFEIMVAVAVSQRTYYKQVAKFMEFFRRQYKSVEEVATTSIEKLVAECKIIGMAKKRAQLIRQLAKTILDHGGLKEFFLLTPERVRETLLGIKGIGEKTADMILVAIFGKSYFIVDSNILRVLTRLGLIPVDSDIYEARKLVEPFVPQEHRVFAHSALVSLGQRICKPINPLCHLCPLRDLCTYYQKVARNVSL